MFVFIKYDRHYPYLPVAIADSQAELARILGISPRLVATYFYHNTSTYAKVEIEDD